MKTNNVASYTDVLVTCMRQNPKWILLSEVRSAEAVMAVRNSISSGHNILSTIHADKASAIPYRMYSLMETDIDVNQFLSTIYRYVQLGVHIRAYYSKELKKFHREVDEVVEFYVDEDNKPQSRTIYQKLFDKEPKLRKPSNHLIEYLENQNIDITEITSHMEDEHKFEADVAADKPKEENKNIINNEIIVEDGDTTDYSVDEEKKKKVAVEAPIKAEAISDEQQQALLDETIEPIKLDDGEFIDVPQALGTAQVVEPAPAAPVQAPLISTISSTAPAPVQNVVAEASSVKPLIPTIAPNVNAAPVNTELKQPVVNTVPQPLIPLTKSSEQIPALDNNQAPIA